MGESTGAAVIFGATGGVMEAALRTAYELVTGREVPFKNLNITPVRGMEGVKEASLKIENPKPEWKFLDGVELKTAVAHERLSNFQLFLEQHYAVGQRNNPALFGFQVVVDRDDNILQEVDAPLISSLTVSIDNLEKEVHRLGGLFIPAHINKSKFSIISQLGFIPSDLPIDGVEISKHTSKKEFLKKNDYLQKYPFIQNSDAHILEGIGEIYTPLMVEEPNFDELRKALLGIGGRTILVE